MVSHRCLSKFKTPPARRSTHTFISSFGPAICALASLLGAQCAHLSIHHSSHKRDHTAAWMGWVERRGEDRNPLYLSSPEAERAFISNTMCDPLTVCAYANRSAMVGSSTSRLITAFRFGISWPSNLPLTKSQVPALW